MSTTPICRCRVLYLGSAVPHVTKDGLQGIQEPLRDLYPEQGSFSAKGIDSWLSVWSNGLLLENVDDSMRQVTRFFNIETLHYCAAVRYVVVPGNNGEQVEKFLPLDSPFTRHADPNHAPLFACILRRTEGIKVLECHAFICKKEAAANALVRCCFHAYADSMQAKHIEENPYFLENKRSQSMSGLNTLEKVEVWRSNAETPFNGTLSKLPSENDRMTLTSLMGGHDDDNYKVWTGIAPTERELMYVDSSGTMRSMKSGNANTQSSQMKTRQMVGPIRPPPPPSPSVLMGKDPKVKSKIKSKGKKKQKEPQFVPKMPGYVLNGFRPASAMDAYGVIVPPPPQGIYAGSGLYTERRGRRMVRPPLSGVEEPIYIRSTRTRSPVSSYQPAVFPHDPFFLQYGTAPRSRYAKGDPVLKRHEYSHAPQIYQNQQYVMDRRINGHSEEYDRVKKKSPSVPRPMSRDGDSDSLAYPMTNGHSTGKKARSKSATRDDDSDSPFNSGMYKNSPTNDLAFPMTNGHDKKKSRSKSDARDDDSDSPFDTSGYKSGPSNDLVVPMTNGHKKSRSKSSARDDDSDSPFNTGIYKKKGHLNERAFSYSIRQEHRSRSNSLANLHFFSPDDHQSGHRSRDEDRKERELAQLVSALNLKPDYFDDHSKSQTSLRSESNFLRRKAPAY